MSPSERETIAAAAARWVARRDAGMSAAEQAAFERWRTSDPRHAAALAHYAATWSTLDRPQQGMAVLQELRRRGRRRRQTLVAAAAAVMMLGSVGWWQFRAAHAPESAVAATAAGVVLAPERRVLPDGSMVELRGDAAIEVAFTPALRRVRLVRGEAHFQVAKNPARPFAVDAGGVQVRAVGTAFSVERDAGQVEVVVTEGRVALESPADAAVSAPAPLTERGAAAVANDNAAVAATSAAPAVLATLGAGERARLPAAVAGAARAEVTPLTDAELAERLAWRMPRLEFSATPLSEAVALMNRSAAPGPERWTLVIDPASKALQREPVTGVFRADNAEAFVRMLELSLGIETERRGRQIVLRQPR